MAQGTEDLSFEKALEKLEAIVRKLEEGDLPLDDSLKMFEEGVKLVRLCGGKLDAAERRIEILMKSEEGRLETTPFDPGASPAGQEREEG
ncbi:MAG TPA: exodeoxyribonuclease VII small subunit [Candidatus Polarisedimenticolia bacterium]|nr:exodeoxyribonuclease VII small subunit [Candidatus Polarisedimenticolia bacterium]